MLAHAVQDREVVSRFVIMIVNISRVTIILVIIIVITIITIVNITILIITILIITILIITILVITILIIANINDLQVIFVSSDRSESDMQQYIQVKFTRTSHNSHAHRTALHFCSVMHCFFALHIAWQLIMYSPSVFTLHGLLCGIHKLHDLQYTFATQL